MADDIILKLDGIKGESKIDGHLEQIDVSSVSAGMSNAANLGAAGGGGAGKVSFQDFHFTKMTDSSSHALQLACADGTHIKEAVIYFRKQGAGKQQEYLVITLTEVIVSSYSMSGGGGGEHPSESFSLAFAKIKYEYKPQDEKGGLGGAKTFTWDVKAAKK